MSDKETLEQFLARGGKVSIVDTPAHKPDTRSDYSNKDKIDVAIKTKSKSLGAQKMFNRFADAFLNKGNNHYKWQKND